MQRLSTHITQSFSRRHRSFLVHYHAMPEHVRMSRFESHRLDYQGLVDRLAEARRRVLCKRDALTLTEKILYAHLDLGPSSPSFSFPYQRLRPDRVACRDTTATMALLQLMVANLTRVAVPTTVHCDPHLIAPAPRTGSSPPHDNAIKESMAAHDQAIAFLEAACSVTGIGLWRPGAGSIHHVLLENYAFPGGMMIGSGTYTANAGGLGMLGISVGGAETIEVMAGLPWELEIIPKVIGVRLTGKLSGWASPKDIISNVSRVLESQGVQGAVLEYCGPGVDTFSCTDMAAVCNMGTELGAMSSIFPFTQRTHDFLCATHRPDVAQAAQAIASTYLSADKGAQYDGIIEIALDTLEPRIHGPFTPDLSTPVNAFKTKVTKEEWPPVLSAALIGSCTNTSYLDMSRAAEIARQAAEKGIKTKVPFMVSTGSEQARARLERDGHLELFESVGGTLLAGACETCTDQWNHMDDYDKAWNSIITSDSQNYQGLHNDNPNTHAFIASPEIVMAMAFAGKLTFNPLRDSIVGSDGVPFKFDAPVDAGEVPREGYCSGTTDEYYQAPANDGSAVVDLHSQSTRLQGLMPFALWDGKDIVQAPILIKVKDINRELSLVQNSATSRFNRVPVTARYYKDRGVPWVVIADEHYGEGTPWEHSVLASCYLNGIVVIAKSFGRIHETNMKKQGILPLMFVDPVDYDNIDPADRVSIVGIKDGMGKVHCLVHKPWGDVVTIDLAHTFSQDQLEWLKAGAGLNTLDTTCA